MSTDAGDLVRSILVDHADSTAEAFVDAILLQVSRSSEPVSVSFADSDPVDLIFERLARCPDIESHRDGTKIIAVPRPSGNRVQRRSKSH